MLCYSLFPPKGGLWVAEAFTASPTGGPPPHDRLLEKQPGGDSVEVAASKAAVMQTFGCVLALWKQ